MVAALEPALAAAAVWEMDDEPRSATLAGLRDEVVVKLLDELPDDGAADLLAALEVSRRAGVMGALEPARRAAVEPLLRQVPGTAGALMSTLFVSVAPGSKVADALRVLRTAKKGGFVYYVYVLTPRGEPRAVTSLRELVVADPDAAIESVAHRDLVSVTASTDQEEVARIASRYDLLAVPVLSADGRMLGLVTADDVLEVLNEEADEDIERFVGSMDTDVGRTDLWSVLRRRAPWVIGAFAVELAVGYAFLRPLPRGRSLFAFVPLVLFVGGGSAIGAAGAMLRRLTLGERSVARLLAREVQGGLLLGAVAAAVCAGALFLAGQDSSLVGVVSWSVGATAFVSATLGCVAPVVIKGFGRDPALASGPLLGVLADAAALAVFLFAARLEF